MLSIFCLKDFSQYLRKNLVFEFFVRKELCVDVDVGEEDNSDVLLVDLKELKEMRNNISPIQRH